jgi:cytochrome c553
MTARLILACAALAWATQGAHAADPGLGAELYGDTCANCHGPTAKGMASYPRLLGKDADYLADRLTTYRAGEKVGPNSMLMIPMAVDLSDDDIANLVAFLTQGS